ncbi:MAG: portal protein, partial [Pseudomonadota bacterium]|nr:portal protein [Pseudomonadota bacterium]
CPAFSVLPAVRGAQQLIRDMILASELNAMPPLGAHTDMMDETVKYAAHQITYGAIDHRGNRKIIPLVEPSDMSGSMAILERLQGLIDRAFFVDMLQIRQDLKSHVTDSQLYQREEEKGILLSPLANQETEWLSVMLDREIDLMDEMGLLDDMPGEVAEALEGGMDLLDVTYDNGLSRAQEAGAAAGYFRMLEQFAPVFQGDQTGEAWGKFTQKYPLEKVLDHMGRINGVPASWEADEDERAEAEAAALHRSKTQDLITALPAIGKSAKDLSQAVATDG